MYGLCHQQPIHVGSRGFDLENAEFLCAPRSLIPLSGFLVIASTRHIRSISDMQEFEYDEFSTLVKTTHRAIREATEIEYLTIIQEESSIHFHLWFFPWTQNVIERYGQPCLTKIREIMADYRKQLIDQAEWMELVKLIEKIKILMMSY